MKHNSVYSFVNYIRRKDNIGGSISILEYNQLAEIAQNAKYFPKLLGLPSGYQKGARDPIQGLGLNVVSEEKLKVLKVLPTPIDIDSNGYANYPADYFRHGPAYYLFADAGDNRQIEILFVNDTKFTERRTTVLDPPSLTDCVCNLGADKLRFLPTALSGKPVFLEYYRLPVAPVMGYAVNALTAENIYVEKGAYIKVLSVGTAGNTLTVTSGGLTLGSYSTVAGDTVEDFMLALTENINANTLTHQVQAIYDGEKIVLNDLSLSLSVVTTAPTGTISLDKVNFTSWSTQFEWENDVEAMDEIINFMLEMMGVSNRDINISQWAQKEQAK